MKLKLWAKPNRGSAPAPPPGRRAAFAVFAVVVMLSSALSTVAATEIATKDDRERAERMKSSLDAIRKGDMSALPQARAALSDPPLALRSSPALRDLDRMITALEDPMVAELMAPLLAAGLFEGTDEEIALRSGEIEARLKKVQSEIAIDTEALAPQWEALVKSMERFNTTDPAVFEQMAATMTDDEMRALTANIVAFTSAWADTSDTELARRMDTVARAIMDAPTADIQAAGTLEPEVFESYQEAMRIMDEVREQMKPENLLGIPSARASEIDPSVFQLKKENAIANLTALYEAFGASENAFLDEPLLEDPVYPDEPTGLVAIDGIGLDGLPLPEIHQSVVVDAGPLEPALPAALAERDATEAPIESQSLGGPVITHKQRATQLGLPGAEGVAFPTAIYNSASTWNEDSPDAPDHAANATDTLLPSSFDYKGTLGPGDRVDAYKVQFSDSFLVRLFLEVDTGNANLMLICASTGREWHSRSDSVSDRPRFDSITFVHNEPGQSPNEAFVPYGSGSQNCPGDDFYLYVYSPEADPSTTIRYLVRGATEWYEEYPCTEPAWAVCGLNWARWGDRCKDDDAACRATSGKRNPHAGATVGNNKNWTTQLQGGYENPVVFVHGVGGLGYNTWVDMESHPFGYIFSMPSVNGLKQLTVIVGAAMIAIGTASFLQCITSVAMFFAATPSIIGAMAGLAIMGIAMYSWSSMILQITQVVHMITSKWRTGSWDVESHFWTTRQAGYETYWIEYNHKDNNALEARKHIQRAGWQVKLATSAIQQDFYDRHWKDPGFPYRSPEDVKVDFVVHSMGGLVTRYYTAAPGGNGVGDDLPYVPEGPSYRSAMYEADVNKWISLQTPNMGSSVAKYAEAHMKVKIGVWDLMMSMFGIAIDLCFGFGGINKISFWWSVIKELISFIITQIVAPMYMGSSIKDRDQLLPGKMPETDRLNSYAPSPDIDYGIIYGIPFPGNLLGIERFDILVAKNDALGPPLLEARMAQYPVWDDHGGALIAGPVRDKLREWLASSDANPPPPAGPFLASLSDLPEEDAAIVLAATAQTGGGSLLDTFGKISPAALETEPGAKYVPDGGALTVPAPARVVEDLGGDRSAKLQRLAALRGFSSEAQGFAAADAATRDALAQAADDPENGSAILGDHVNGSSSTTLSTTPRRDLAEVAPDLAILRAGHSRDASMLAEAIGEPNVMVSTTVTAHELSQRDILLVPTGGLSGASARFAATLEQFAREGGTIVVLGQAQGADLAALPGAPEGFGFQEEDGAYRDSVVFGAFTPALAGQSDATPDLSVDGSLTKLPEGATVLLKSAKNARPILASYAWGEGRVIVGSILSDWARASGRGTVADTLLLRDLLADARAPEAASIGAPGAALTLDVDLSTVVGDAASVTLVLVNDGAKEATRETFDVSSGAALAWALPENVTRARHYSVDAILRDAEGNATMRLLDVQTLYASHFAANPDGFRPSFAPAALDVVTPSDRVENGGDLTFDLRVTNLQDEPADLVVGWWFPEHATLTGDAATYGAGAPRDGAQPAWEDNFQLRQSLTVPAGEAVTLARTLTGVARSDAITARLYSQDGSTVLGEARRAFTAYTPTVSLNLSTDAAHYAGGDDIALTVVAYDTAAGADAGARPAALTATLRGPDGASVTTATGSVLIGPAEQTTTLTLALPEDAPVGAYVASVEARFGATRIGSATTSTRIPGAQLAADVELPAAFEAGSAAGVTYTLSNPGVAPFSSATFAVSLVSPAGAIEWSATTPLSLAAGESTMASFDVTPTTAMPGTYTLAYTSTIDGVEFAGELPIRSGASVTVTTSQPDFKARDAFTATARVANDGRFTLPLAIAADAEGIDSDALAATLAPGESAEIVLSGTVPATISAGAHPIDVVLTLPDGAIETSRSYTVPPAELSLTPPGGASAIAGETLLATLANAGGVDGVVPWVMRLLDESGREVAISSAIASVQAGDETTIAIVVPAQARSGSYRLAISADTGAQRATTATRTIAIAGVSGTIALTAPQNVAPAASIGLSATPTSTGVALENARIEFTAIHPAPLPAWVPIDGAAGTSVVEHDGARWLGTADGLLRVDAESGAITTIGTSDGLPSDKITSLAVARGMLHVGTDRGLAWLDGAVWREQSTLGTLPTRDIRALSGNDAEAFIATDSGTARFDGTTVTTMAFSSPAARAVAATEDTLYVSLADVATGFNGADVQPIVKTGTSTANPAIAITPDGDVHVIYVDNTTNTTFQLKHVHLTANGALVSGPHVIRNGTNSVALTGLASDSAGGLHAVWEDYRTGDADVYYRKIGADGQLLSDEIALGQHPTTSQRWARVAVGPGDAIYVTWADDRDPNPSGPDFAPRGSEVYFAKLDAAGNVVIPQTRLTFSTGNVLIPRIAIDGSGNLHATYTDRVKRCDREFPTICWPNLESFYAKWDANGAQLVAPKVVSNEDDDISYLPGIGVEPNGAVHIVYQELGHNGGMYYAQVSSGGQVTTTDEQLTTFSVNRPSLLARSDGRFDVIYSAFADGKSHAWRNILDPSTGSLVLASPERVSSVPGAGELGSPVNGFAMQSTISPSGRTYVAWDDQRVPGWTQWRIASTDTRYTGKGVAVVDLGTMVATSLTTASGALPSDDVLGLAAEGDLTAFTTAGAVTFRDGRTGSLTTIDAPGATGPIALHGGVAYVADGANGLAVDLETREARALDDGGPDLRALASASDGVLAAGLEGAALLRDDREQRFGTTLVAAADGGASFASIAAPAEQGRYRVRATLLSDTGQTLDIDERDVFVLDGALAITIQPATILASAGERVDIHVTVGNPGAGDLRSVQTTVTANGATILDETVDLGDGEARTFTVTRAAGASYDLVASASGVPAALGGSTTRLTSTARDHVRIAAPELSARIVAPDAATRAPVSIDALLENRGPLPLALAVGLEGHPARAVTVPAHARLLVEDLAEVAAIEDTLLRLVVSGDATLTREHMMRAGDRTLLAEKDGLAGAPGARTLTLAFANGGTLTSTFPLALALDGVALPATSLAIPPGSTLRHDVALTLAPGLHELTFETPWESGAMRVVASDSALPLLSIDGLDVDEGNVSADVRVENAGPGRLVGALEIDLGFHVEAHAIDLAQGDAATLATSVALAGIAPGDALVAARFLRDGSPVAEASQAYVVPGPILSFVSFPADLDVAPGQSVTLTYEVENVGDATGPADVKVAVGGADAIVTQVQLAPGERATVQVATRIEPDARDGALAVVATATGASVTSALRVTGARVNATATPDQARYAAGSTATIRIDVENLANVADLLVSASLSGRSAQAPLALASGAAGFVDLPLEVGAGGEVTWSVSTASGRALAQGTTRLALDTLASTGIRVEADQANVPAGGFVTITATSDREGRFDVVGPGFRDAFTLNGTEARTYLVPSSVRAGRYTVLYNFDATNATGDLPLGVRGQEIESLRFGVEDAAGEPLAFANVGDALDATWLVRAAAPGAVTLRTWIADATGAASVADAYTVTLVAGANSIAFEKPVEGIEPGAATIFATLELPDAPPGGDVLARASSGFAVAGFALRDARIELGDGFAWTLVAELEARPAQDAALAIHTPGALVRTAKVRVDGLVSNETSFVAPEPGAYDVRLEVVGGGRTFTRVLKAEIPGAGTPPVTTLTIEGPSFLGEDGVLALAPHTRVLVSATDEGAGVAQTIALTDDGTALAEDGRLPAGRHNLSYHSVDHAGNKEVTRTLAILVDGEAPDLAVVDPYPGDVHVAGSLVAGAPRDTVIVVPVETTPLPTSILDSDGDGHTDAEEVAEGSDPQSAQSTPARYMPPAPPTFAVPVFAIGALRVDASAADEGAGVATIRALLDGREVASTAAQSATWTIDLAAEAPGDHVLTIESADAVGNLVSRDIRVQVVPLGAEGLRATDPSAPRVHPFAPEMAAWLQVVAADLPGALEGEQARREARAAAEQERADRELVQPLTPPVIDELPAQVQRDLEAIQRAVEDLRRLFLGA